MYGAVLAFPFSEICPNFRGFKCWPWFVYNFRALVLLKLSRQQSDNFRHGELSNNPSFLHLFYLLPEIWDAGFIFVGGRVESFSSGRQTNVFTNQITFQTRIQQRNSAGFLFMQMIYVNHKNCSVFCSYLWCFCCCCCCPFNCIRYLNHLPVCFCCCCCDCICLSSRKRILSNASNIILILFLLLTDLFR